MKLKFVVFGFLIIFLAVLTGCKDKTEIRIDPNFSIYGEWQYVELDEAGNINVYVHDDETGPNSNLHIIINDDNSMHAFAYETDIRGTIAKIDVYNYQFKVTTRSVMWTSETVDDVIDLTYDPVTRLLKYDDRGEVHYFIKKPNDGASSNEAQQFNGNDPITLAQQAYYLIMQMEGRDNHDPAVSAKMSAIQEIVETLPETTQRIYYALLERLYHGESTLVQTVDFKNQKIPITVFYTSDDGGYRIISLEFMYDGKKQTVWCTDSELHFNDLDDFGLISPADYNFDNHMDISIIKNYGSGGVWEDIFIYDPQKRSYYYQEELSAHPTVWIDSETQTVKSHGKGGHAGLIYYFREYKWINGQLTLIHTISQDYDVDLNLYICITRTLQNGKWVEQIETFKEEDFMGE
jgi:hypothetical protein